MSTPGTAAAPDPIRKMSQSLKALDEGVALAAQSVQLPQSQGAARGGTWQWSWFPEEQGNENSGHLLLLADGDEEGWNLSLLGLGIPHIPVSRREYYRGRLFHENLAAQVVSDTLADQLKRAWGDVRGTSSERAEPS